MPLVHHDTKNLTKSAPAGLSKMLHDAMASLMARFRGDSASVKGAGWTDSARAGTTAPPSPLPRRAAAVQANPTFSPAARRNARASDAGAMTYAEAAGPAAAPVMHALDAESTLLTVMGRSRASLPCLRWLAEQGATLVSGKSFAPSDPIWAAPRAGYVIVDVEAMGGITAIASDLMALRLKRPDLIVILMSNEFERHDFGQERLALCDISLRLPCTFAALELALVEAEINNWAWFERLSDAAHSQVA